MSVYVIIPARGGSKGIPGKNLRPVGGVPLVVRAISAALRARLVDRVFVTTDDETIAEIAGQAGAEVIQRPVSLAGDEASSESALVHALDTLRGRGGPDPDIVVMVQCTSPFTSPGDIDGTVDLVLHGDADSGFTAAPSHSFLWRPGPDGAVAVNHDAAVRPRRQDRPPEFVESGAVYAMRTAGFRNTQHRFFGTVGIFEVSPEHGLEIDELVDLTVAETLARDPASLYGRDRLPGTIAALVLDFDGVLTDNRVMIHQDGTEAVIANRSDGLGIELLRNTGLTMAVLSKETNPVVAARCKKLSLECIQGLDDKAGAFRQWMTAHDLDPATVVFIGNDVNDVECLRLAGCGVAVADAHPSARAAADVILTQPGGRGAVRELADLMLDRAKGS